MILNVDTKTHFMSISKLTKDIKRTLMLSQRLLETNIPFTSFMEIYLDREEDIKLVGKDDTSKDENNLRF